MKTIPLTMGKVAVVSDRDYKSLKAFTWNALKSKNGIFYAVRNTNRRYVRKMIYMHRVILGVTDPKIKVDHNDHNGLNNSRSNIRIASQSQNLWNCRRHQDGSSKFKGVTWDKRASKWVAQIYHKKKHVHIGTFSNEADAGAAYYERAQMLYGKFAYQETVK